MKNVVEKIKNIEIPNLFPEPPAAGVGKVIKLSERCLSVYEGDWEEGFW
ncbi:hypothetical protein ABE069_20005 [Bacillus mycoides]